MSDSHDGHRLDTRDEQLVADWVDGVMTDAERVAFEAECARRPDLARAAERWTRVVERLQRGLVEDAGADANSSALTDRIVAAARDLPQDSTPEQAEAGDESVVSGGGSVLRSIWFAPLLAAAAVLVLSCVIGWDLFDRGLLPATGPVNQLASDSATARGNPAETLETPSTAALELRDKLAAEDMSEALLLQQEVGAVEEVQDDRVARLLHDVEDGFVSADREAPEAEAVGALEKAAGRKKGEGSLVARAERDAPSGGEPAGGSVPSPLPRSFDPAVPSSPSVGGPGSAPPSPVAGPEAAVAGRSGFDDGSPSVPGPSATAPSRAAGRNTTTGSVATREIAVLVLEVSEDVDATLGGVGRARLESTRALDRLQQSQPDERAGVDRTPEGVVPMIDLDTYAFFDSPALKTGDSDGGDTEARQQKQSAEPTVSEPSAAETVRESVRSRSVSPTERARGDEAGPRFRELVDRVLARVGRDQDGTWEGEVGEDAADSVEKPGEVAVAPRPVLSLSPRADDRYFVLEGTEAQIAVFLESVIGRRGVPLGEMRSDVLPGPVRAALTQREDTLTLTMPVADPDPEAPKEQKLSDPGQAGSSARVAEKVRIVICLRAPTPPMESGEGNGR